MRVDGTFKSKNQLILLSYRLYIDTDAPESSFDSYRVRLFTVYCFTARMGPLILAAPVMLSFLRLNRRRFLRVVHLRRCTYRSSVL